MNWYHWVLAVILVASSAGGHEPPAPNDDNCEVKTQPSVGLAEVDLQAIPVSPSDGQSQFVCLADLDSLVLRLDASPLGCELVDCCPGCPSTFPIDVRLVVDPGGLGTVHLRVTGLAVDQFLHLGSAADSVSRGAVWVTAPVGESLFRGYTRRRDAAAVVTPVVVFDSVAIATATAGAAAGGSIGEVSISIEQKIEAHTLSSHNYLVRLGDCPRPAGTGDRFRVTNNDGEDHAVVFIDAQTPSGCVDDGVFTVATERAVNNFVNVTAGCRSEVAIFSDDDAVQVVEDVAVWTDAAGDLFTGDLSQPRWQVPVSIKVVVPSRMRGKTLKRARDDLRHADHLYNVNHSGIDLLSLKSVGIVPDKAEAALTQSVLKKVVEQWDCEYLDNLIPNLSDYDPKVLNVFYVDEQLTGLRCSSYETILIGTLAQPATLAHELGHEFALNHTDWVDEDDDGICDFTQRNIMWAEVSGRDSFTEGQSFRMNLDSTSALNDIPVRTTGPIRTCPDDPASKECIWIAKDG